MANNLRDTCTATTVNALSPRGDGASEAGGDTNAQKREQGTTQERAEQETAARQDANAAHGV